MTFDIDDTKTLHATDEVWLNDTDRVVLHCYTTQHEGSGIWQVQATQFRGLFMSRRITLTYTNGTDAAIRYCAAVAKLHEIVSGSVIVL